MSDRPASRRPRQRSAPHSSVNDAVSGGVRAEQEIAGTVAEQAATRSGEDVRRRGWFWHWNSIVTQYAPLIGLKGVGLLNSYTVWTDRREESPTRGYAFPSQQSEADFYGEDRAELITINKILVALDLIEIRKEMVLRVDEQGRRWKVPHNFYRVKDHGDGSTLTIKDVLKVAELADRDAAVYRYVRRVFSARFSPIDRDNVWTGILEEVRQTEVWQRLTARTQRDEQRASERTKAGHASRKSALFLPEDGDTPTSATTKNDSRPVAKQRSTETSVANANNGLEVDVAATNNGSTVDSTSSVAPSNRGRSTGVAQTNRTYDQFALTTTTTTASPDLAEKPGDFVDVDNPGEGSHSPVTTPENRVTDRFGSGPGESVAPDDALGQEAAIRAFEDANGRRSTPAERQLLRGLAERFAPAATGHGAPGRDTGWAWLTAAIYEAVEAGSAYVAPRRLREILTRWEREGLESRQQSAVSNQHAESGPHPSVPPIWLPHGSGGKTSPNVGRGTKARRSRTVVDVPDAQSSGLSPQPSVPSPQYSLCDTPDIELPHGFGSRRTWAFTVTLLSGAIEPGRLAELVNGTAIAGYREGEVIVSAPSQAQAERLAGEYGELVARKLSEAMRRPVRLAVLVPQPAADTARAEAAEPAGAVDMGPVDSRGSLNGAPDAEPTIPNFIVAECGLPSAQVWAAILDEVASVGEVSTANVDAWLRSTRLIGRGGDGRLIVGAVHGLAQRRIASRFMAPLRAAARAILGAEIELEIVVSRDWLLAGGAAVPDSRAETIGAA